MAKLMFAEKLPRFSQNTKNNKTCFDGRAAQNKCDQIASTKI